MLKVRAGSEVTLEVRAEDLINMPPELFDPTEGVKLTLKNASGTTVLNQVPMTKTAVGKYIHRHQTVTSDPLGVWTLEVRAEDNGAIHLSQEIGAFVLVAK